MHPWLRGKGCHFLEERKWRRVARAGLPEPFAHFKIGERAPRLTLRGTNDFVIKRHERALRAPLGPAVQARGLERPDDARPEILRHRPASLRGATFCSTARFCSTWASAR
jgi:alpha-beta hydrolase superfamily lysophospholipase